MNENATIKIVKLILVSCAEIAIIIVLANLITIIEITSYVIWVAVSTVIVIVCGLIVCAFTFVFFRDEFDQIIKMILHIFKRSSK